ncbi:hypothetical protein BJ993_000866 [Nocardioides aromaticivorans]|uniref:DUF4126 domain-containing protein n=1 Tax=Nocardioides aromaticivorans TaxID=200618 RepID=A0A7Z0CJK9_9ACTN|nr:DUF4126 domain-containing protein [Nocardioides aromaticivorans]NYI43786.1 hypothetical protein [Nocardioides aromaticivorans]
MESLALAFSSGWASGINSYLVVLVLGLADRFGSFADIPDALGKWEVLAAAAVMYAFEFVADKVPFVDTVWDVVSTVIRPMVGGTVGVLIAGDTNAINDLVGGSVGGTSALASHAIKTSTRIAVNTSPEPFTNIAVSIGEDLLVLAVIWFAVNHPVAAAVVALVLLVLSLLVLWMAWKLVRRGWARFQAWRARRRGVSPGALT